MDTAVLRYRSVPLQLIREFVVAFQEHPCRSAGIVEHRYAFNFEMTMSRDLHVPYPLRTHQRKDVGLHVATGVGVFVANLGGNDDQIFQRARSRHRAHDPAQQDR